MFSCGVEPLSFDPHYEVEGFVDTVPVSSTFELGAPFWELTLDAASEEVEFAGGCIA